MHITIIVVVIVSCTAYIKWYMYVHMHIVGIVMCSYSSHGE